MKIILAPMEGVIDFPLREILTKSGSYDYAMTEFVRVNDHKLPESVYYKFCPELKNGGMTSSGTPVYVQLLGQHSDWMAENAVQAAGLGALGIDLNFGCPAKTVNSHRGGSILLNEPETVFSIVSAVRKAVPSNIPVTVKMRLGYEEKTLAIENAIAIESAGANLLTIHARTKAEGYTPPAHWHWIAKIKKYINIPVVANGEIWSRQDAIECIRVSSCENIMIGRGGLALPNIADVIRNNDSPATWEDICHILIAYSRYEREDVKNRYLCNRIKQWFRFLVREYIQANELFHLIKKHRELDFIISEINSFKMM